MSSCMLVLAPEERMASRAAAMVLNGALPDPSPLASFPDGETWMAKPVAAGDAQARITAAHAEARNEANGRSDGFKKQSFVILGLGDTHVEEFAFRRGGGC